MAGREILISDNTLYEIDEHCSFKEKIDIIKKIDSLKVNMIEVPSIENEKADTLLLHTVAPLVKYCGVFCGAGYSVSKLESAWNAVKSFKKPGITVSLPTSTVQMEYICHKKAPALLSLCEELVTKAASYGCPVEFKAEDASRAEPEFLMSIVDCAVNAGASFVTICDSTGTLLPNESYDLIKSVVDRIGDKKERVTIGIQCSDLSSVSVANSLSALNAGATLVKTVCSGSGAASLDNIINVINKRTDTLDATSRINYTILGRTVSEIKSISETKKSEFSPFDSGVRNEDTGSITITADDNVEKIVAIASSLGYELSDADADKVYENAHRLAVKKPIGKKELEVVIATSAMQIPSTYTIVSYVINSGNIISPTAHIKLDKNGEVLSGISVGDGPIDAAFLSIEQIMGRHFELDDFQIRAITEGREAVGEALVKIRYNGKLYSGRGVSTDIIGASIRAYVIAVNKICYEENMQ